MLRSFSGIFSVVVMVFITIILAIAFYSSTTEQSLLSPWMQIVYDSMLCYLIFSVFRMLFLILFSFAEFFFRKKIKELSHYPLVSVIIPCFNEEKVIKNAIESVNQLDYPNYEILIVDDGSTDLTLETAKIKEQKAKIRVIYQENTGKSGALNRGISEAVGEYVFCMDADSVISRNSLRQGLAYFEQTPRLAAVAGSVHIGNTNRSGNWVTLFQKLEYLIGLNLHKAAQSFFRCVTIIPGPVGLFKKSVIIDLGGYHVDTFAEDCDLTLRILLKGYQIAYCPEMIAVTEGPDDFRQLIVQRYRWTRGIIQSIAKHSSCLFHPFRSLRSYFILNYMLVESIVIPTLNFAFTLITIQHGLMNQTVLLMGPFFAGLTLLDMVLALYCVATEHQNFLLMLLAGLNRLTYGLALEVLRFLAIIDELFKIPMNWGKLIRKGLSTQTSMRT